MAEAADAQHGYEIPGLGGAVTKRIECRDPGTHHWSRFHGGQLVGDLRERLGGSDHVIGVAAVVGDARHLGGDATGDEITAPTGITVAAMSAMPADPDALSRGPSGHVCADRIDDAGDFVPGHARILDAGEEPFLCVHVTVADAAGLNLDSYRSDARLRNLALDELE